MKKIIGLLVLCITCLFFIGCAQQANKPSTLNIGAENTLNQFITVEGLFDPSDELDSIVDETRLLISSVNPDETRVDDLRNRVIAVYDVLHPEVIDRWEGFTIDEKINLKMLDYSLKGLDVDVDEYIETPSTARWATTVTSVLSMALTANQIYTTYKDLE